jgi:hypothetical protein
MRRFPTRLTCILLLLPFALCACGGSGGNGALPPPAPERILFNGAGDLGIFDPSLARDPGSGRLWMSYSSVETSAFYAPNVYWAVSIRLAFSDDNGRSWQDAGVAVSARSENLVGPLTANHPSGDIPAASPGIWQSETSSLVYDPGAAPSARWKILWHQYLHANATSYFADYAWIAMKSAGTPADLASAPAVKLFAGAGLQPQHTLAVAPTFAPIAGAAAIQLNTDLAASIGGADRAELNLCVFAEPGLHATASAGYLAMFCADASTVPITEYIVYFRCASPCTMTSAAGWSYAGRLLTPADARAATADDHFQAADLVTRGSDTYLLVTPVDTGVANRYDGCRAYRFTSLDSNQLERSLGVLVEHARVDGDVGTHHGACAGFDGVDGGLLLSQFGTPGGADAFQIFRSQVFLP